MIFMEGVVRGPKGEETLEFILDTGTGYTLVPHDVWERIGLEPNRTESFRLVDGSRMTRRMSECHITLPEGSAHTPVILGEPDDEALLGVVTLENIGQVFNPFTRRLQKMRLTL
jgi:predicted aspartyl protease